MVAGLEVKVDGSHPHEFDIWREKKAVDYRRVILRSYMDRLTQPREVIAENEGLHRDAMVRTLSLPPSESVHKIIRYETTIERQLYRAVSQLERLQRRRMGEPVSPPVTLDITTGK